MVCKSDLKKIRERHKYYDQEHIDEVISRVSKEPALKYELESLSKVYNELTSTYSDVIRKYSLLGQGLDAEFAKFENETNKRILHLKEQLNNKFSDVMKKSNSGKSHGKYHAYQCVQGKGLKKIRRFQSALYDG